MLAHGIDKRFDRNLRAVGKSHAQKLCWAVFAVGIPDGRDETVAAELGSLGALVGEAKEPHEAEFIVDAERFHPRRSFSRLAVFARVVEVDEHWRVENGRHGIERGAITDLNMLFALVVDIAETSERRNLNFDFASGFDIFRYLVHGCLSFLTPQLRPRQATFRRAPQGQMRARHYSIVY